MGESAVRVGLYGASGALGTQVVEALEGEGVPVASLQPLGGTHAGTTEVGFRGKSVPVLPVAKAQRAAMDVAVLAVPAEASAPLRASLVSEGVVVVDASRGARRDPGVPLWWPGSDDEHLASHGGVLAVAGPLSSTVAPVAAAVVDAAPVEALDAVALLPAAAAGREGTEALSAQTMALLSFRMPDPGPLGGVLAFNLMAGSPELRGVDDPWADDLVSELPRLVPALVGTPVRAMCLRAPVFSGVTVALTARLRGGEPGEPRGRAERVWAALADADGVTVEAGPLALRDSMEGDDVLVRPLSTGEDGGLQMLLVADATRRVGYAIAALIDKIQREELW